LKDVRKMTNEPTAEEELARSIDRLAEAIKYLGDAIRPLETHTLAAAIGTSPKPSGSELDGMPRKLAMFGTVIATAARCVAKP
jgi:hypothetical protein